MARDMAIYTVVCGDFDAYLPSVDVVEEGVDYLCFSDRSREESGPWEIRNLAGVFGNARRDSRRPKLLPHLFLPEYDRSLYIDANISLTAPCARLLFDALEKCPIVGIRHEERDCLYDEAVAVLRLRKDVPEVVRAQMLKYRSLGFPAHFGLTIGGFLARRHNDPRCKVFNDLWWNEYCAYSRRDQLSLDFVRWATRQEVAWLPVKYTDTPLFRWGPEGTGGHARLVRE